ncbi:MAG TPA: hypothetical protein VGN06_09430 [Gaiellaceae bacterium]
MIPCTPHPGLGKVTFAHVQVDLATCAQRRAVPVPPPSSDATVSTKRESETVLFKGKVVLTISERHNANGMLPGPLFCCELSPDKKWIFYAIDPYGSNSYAADGLMTRAIRATGGRSYVVSSGIGDTDYRAWCGGRLVVTAGTNRIATEHKWLVVTGPPDWKAKRLVAAPGRAFGSMVCSPDGKSIVVQSQPSSTNAYFFATHWALWRIGLDGSMTQLTHPPAHHADESPHFAGGVLYFARSIKGVGKLYALKRGKLVGPLLSFGYQLGYYGHQIWPYAVTR